MQDNTCLMPGEMGRTQPTEGKTADELITQNGGVNILKGRRMSINTGHTPPMTYEHKLTQGNTPGGPAREPAPQPPGVEAKAGVPDMPNIPPPPPKKAEEFSWNQDGSVTQGQLPDTTRMVIDIPNGLSREIVAAAEQIGVETQTVVLFAIDSFVRRRRN